MRILDERGPTPAGVVDEHVALPGAVPADRAFVRLNMIASADGGTAVGGVSGALGNRDDHAPPRLRRRRRVSLPALREGVVVTMEA